VNTELAACNAAGAHVLLEPAARNTAPAIAFAARFCLDELGVSGSEVLFVTPSDHIVWPAEVFAQSVRQAAKLAGTGRLVTFGVVPDKPETGYGYIQAGEPCGDGYEIASFREKPDQETAREYVAAGYYWNSGMFAFTLECMLAELAAHAPEIAAIMDKGLAQMTADFAALPNISLDYAIAEKSSRAAVIPLAARWNDIGSWDAIYDVMEKDSEGNALRGDCLPLDCRNSLLIGQSRLIAGIGLENLLVVETDDVILVAQKGESQKVKDVVAELRERGRKEASEHTTMYRPWGSYTVLGEGPGYKMKKIVVKPGGVLSLQLHYHRSEHWIVISGTAKVTIGEKEMMLNENSSIFVPQSTRHRLENPGRLPLEIIEVQNGPYLGEDDIVRFEDIYGRS
jgi:mannose-1-phosphate guanylyltransferase/mannose-6-phosphate isomerase